MPVTKKNKRLKKKDIEKLEATSAVASGDSLVTCQEQNEDEEEHEEDGQQDPDHQNPVQVTLSAKNTEYVE